MLTLRPPKFIFRSGSDGGCIRIRGGSRGTRQDSKKWPSKAAELCGAERTVSTEGLLDAGATARYSAPKLQHNERPAGFRAAHAGARGGIAGSTRTYSPRRTSPQILVLFLKPREEWGAFNNRQIGVGVGSFASYLKDRSRLFCESGGPPDGEIDGTHEQHKEEKGAL